MRLRSRHWIVAAAALLAACDSSRPPPDAPVERVTVPPGASFAQVTDSLVARGIIRHRWWFTALARVQRLDREIQAGVYEFPAAAPSRDVLRALVEGRAAYVRFTVPEGLTVAEVAALAEARLGLPADSILAAAAARPLLDRLGLDRPSLEGFLFPETYTLPVTVTPRELVLAMVRGFERAWRPDWNARLDSLGLDRAELVALASIVEGEARVQDERAVIAAVYHNRLRAGMPLQADPTVQYAILQATGRRKTRLFEKDYGFASPYNTYLNPGLPPGPISSPGGPSMEAALYPADVPYLFFVARPDGRHVFSRTYREHLRAIAEIRGAPRAP